MVQGVGLDSRDINLCSEHSNTTPFLPHTYEIVQD